MDPLRLGSVRRNRSEYSVHQRSAGKDCGDRLVEELLNSLMLLLITDYLMEEEDGNDDEDRLEVILLIMLMILDINTPNLITPIPIQRATISFDSFYDAEYEDKFGFSRASCETLFAELEFPPYLIIGKGSHAFQVDSIHCFLYCLYRLHSPSSRQVLDQREFCYDYSTLSRIFTSTIEFIDEKFSHKLRNLPQIVDLFPIFNERIISKMLNLLKEDETIPDDCLLCCLFADGVRFRVSRPTGDYWVQKAVFSGDKWFHNYGSLAVMAPNGIIYDWYDIPLGRYNDKHFMADSHINETMEIIQQDKPQQFWIYTDKGFDRNTCVRCAAHGPGFVSAEQKADNKMSKLRIAEEWGFGKVKMLFPFVERPDLLKLQCLNRSRYLSYLFEFVRECLA